MDAIRECAACLGIDFDDCHRVWREISLQLVRGEFASVADEFGYIARQLGKQVTPATLSEVEERYQRFTLKSL